jgi:hypothetical protein
MAFRALSQGCADTTQGILRQPQGLDLLLDFFAQILQAIGHPHVHLHAP